MKFIFALILMFLTACSTNNNNERETRNANIFNRQFVKYPTVVESELTLGEAATDIIDSGENRVSNILLACSKINGKEILPGEEFSFNNITGRKTEKDGYKYAPVLINGEKSYGVGGGVCQVSTTIYMAALNAGIEITEHYNHSEPIAYAPEGMDATVVFGEKDFRFRNNTDKSLYIYTWVEKEKVFAKIIQKSIDIQQ